MLELIRNSHPLVYRHFSALQDGEEHLRAIRAIDSYWDAIERPVPVVLRNGSGLPSGSRIEGAYDLVYAGGTLGMLHAAVMAVRHGRKVLLMDRADPGRSTRDWNISRQELLRLSGTGLFTEAELDSVIVRRYRTGWVEFHVANGRQKRLYIDDVLDCAVDADRLLGMARERLLQCEGCVILARTAFSCCYRFDDHVVIQAEAPDGSPLFFRANLFVDAMGIVSPVAMQLNGGRPQTHVCPTVGTIASGFEGVDFEVGEILASTEPAETGHGRGRQLIWEGFPAKGDEYITYLFFYDTVESANDKTLLGLFETYFRKLADYKRIGPDFTIHRPVYGIIPAWFHEGTGCTRRISDDRILLLGDAASLGSPLTFCGFGSMVRNMERLTSGLEKALQENRLSMQELAGISAFEHNVAVMANLMRYMCFDYRTDDPDFVNELMNEVMIVLDAMPSRYRQAMFRDEMKLEELVVVMLRVAWNYPKILHSTWVKLGVPGVTAFVKNIAGWAMAPAGVRR